MICPSVGSQCAMSAARYPAARRFSICFSFMVEATHLPPAPDMFSCAEETWAWALELEGARVGKRRKKAWVKMGKSYPFIEATKAVHLPTCPLGIACFPSATIDGVVGLPIPVLMRIP